MARKLLSATTASSAGKPFSLGGRADTGGWVTRAENPPTEPYVEQAEIDPRQERPKWEKKYSFFDFLILMDLCHRMRNNSERHVGLTRYTHAVVHAKED